MLEAELDEVEEGETVPEEETGHETEPGGEEEPVLASRQWDESAGRAWPLGLLGEASTLEGKLP